MKLEVTEILLQITCRICHKNLAITLWDTCMCIYDLKMIIIINSKLINMTECYLMKIIGALMAMLRTVIQLLLLMDINELR